MNIDNVQNFRDEFQKLLNKWQVTFKTCGCCDGVDIISEKFKISDGFIEKGPSCSYDEYLKNENTSKAINGDPRYI